MHNAIEAVDTQKPRDAPDREIHVYIWDTEEAFIFQIWIPSNPGNNPERVFAGATLKGRPRAWLRALYRPETPPGTGRGDKCQVGPENGTEFYLEFPKNQVNRGSSLLAHPIFIPVKSPAGAIDVFCPVIIYLRVWWA